MEANLSFQEKCECAQSHFCTYVNHVTEFSPNEKAYLVKVIVNDRISGILYVSGILAGWSFIAGIIDAVLFPGIIIYAIFHGVIDYKVLTPPILFLLGNIIAKLIYISTSLRGRVKVYDILIAVLPYAGSAYLLKKFLVKDKLLSKAVFSFLKMRKQETKKQFLALFTSKRTQ